MSMARDGIIKMINADPTIITITRKAVTDDGFGQVMEDPSGATRDYRFRVRISHEKSSVPGTRDAPIGVSTNLSRMMTIDFHGGIVEGETFTVLEKNKSKTLTTVLSDSVAIEDDSDKVAFESDTDTVAVSYTVGKIDALTLGGEVIGYQAALLQAAG